MKKWELEWFWDVDNKRKHRPSPQDRGSYVLLIQLNHQIVITRPSNNKMPPGWYAYAGSARNGILARLKWHKKKNKRLTWHVDQLTTHGHLAGVLWSKSLSECDFADMLRKRGYNEIVKGFGASDCTNNCFSHLFWLSCSETGQPLFDLHVGLNLSRNL